MQTVRAKFRLTTIRKTQWMPESPWQTTYEFTPQYDMSIPEDQRFCKATPSGKIEMVIDNPVAVDVFVLGRDYYFDATEATKT